MLEDMVVYVVFDGMFSDVIVIEGGCVMVNELLVQLIDFSVLEVLFCVLIV